MKPRIAIITRSIDRSGTSGSGHHFREMIKHLIPQAPDLDITFAHYSEPRDEIYRLAPDIQLPLNPLRAAGVLNRKRFDVVHFSPLTVVAPIHGLHAKKVATVHSAEPTLLPHAYSWIKRVHSNHLIPRYMRRLDALMTVSETSKRWFRDNWGMDETRTYITYNACSPAYRRLSPQELDHAGPNVPAVGSPFILHVSRFSERKNPWTMIEAFARLIQDRSLTQLSLVLAGKGWDGDEVRQRIHELGIASQVITPGFVDEQTVVHLMNRAEIFWFPSLSEGFGMPNIEAMSCGCPVITSAVFAVPEIVGDAAVVLDDPRDTQALVKETERLLSNQEKRNQLITRGLSWVTRYSWDRSARILADVYRKLANPAIS